jgi:hypothetical protein
MRAYDPESPAVYCCIIFANLCAPCEIIVTDQQIPVHQLQMEPSLFVINGSLEAVEISFVV